ncbi:MAG: DUF58 domain-containing protein [Acidimicrobiia bacterium]|nr:DUF58 domain-containing protein [Acidimicrobiia bacterium]
MTRYGQAVAALAACLLVGGWVAGYRELFMFGVALLVVLVVASGWLLARPHLDADRELRPNRVAEGQPATGFLTVTNRSRRRSPAMVVLEHFGSTVVPVSVPTLAGGASHTRPYRLPTNRRGVFQVGPLTVSRSDPFQLVRAGQRQPSSETLWVHPATHEMSPFPNGRARDLEGPTSAEAQYGGITFHTLRDYVVGDDLRLIHWKSSAKRGELMVRHNVDAYQPRSLVVLDVNRASYSDEGFEDAVRVVASIVVSSLRNNFPIRLRTTAGLVIGTESGSGSQRERILDQLAALEPVPEVPLASISRQVANERGGLSLAVITGEATARDLAVIGPLRGRFQTITIGRIGVRGRGSVHALPGALLINAATSAEFATAWSRRVGG